jgi:C1A family cysteine protease
MRLVALCLVLWPTLAWAQGAAIETLDDVAQAPVAEAYRDVLPQKVDLSDAFGPPRSQGPTETCTSWAATYGAASQAIGRQPGSRDAVRLSPAFSYPLSGGGENCLGPTKISRTLDVLREVGALPIEEYAFDAGWCGRRPTEAERIRAAQYRIRGWSRLEANNLAAVKGQLARGRPVLFAMQHGPSLPALRGSATIDTMDEAAPQTSHSMVLVGYDDARQAFRLMNSYGRAWGDGGFAWLSYRLWQEKNGPKSVAFVID